MQGKVWRLQWPRALLGPRHACSADESKRVIERLAKGGPETRPEHLGFEASKSRETALSRFLQFTTSCSGDEAADGPLRIRSCSRQTCIRRQRSHCVSFNGRRKSISLGSYLLVNRRLQTASRGRL